MWVTCGLGLITSTDDRRPQRDHVALQGDAIFINRWSGSGMCWRRLPDELPRRDWL
jgi:hypothetical protein